MKKLPSSINVLGKKYKVQIKNEILYEGRECYGLADFNRRAIFIKSDLLEKDTWETFLHELLHVVTHESAVWLSMDPNTEHIYVEQAAKTLTDILFD